MSIEDRQRWEKKHAQRSALTPRASVLGLPSPKRSGALALDLACGQGRHSLALRRTGYRVVAMDVARPALDHLREAAGNDDDLCVLQGDADSWPFAAASFDLIVQVDFLDRRLFPVLRESLASGGLLLIDTFLLQDHANAEGPSNPDFLLRPGELPDAFAGMVIERYEETTGKTGRATMLARRP